VIPRKLLRGLLGVLGVIVLLELASRSGLVDQTGLPPASTVLRKAGGLAADGEFLGDVWGTVSAWFAALLLATAIGVPAGLLLGSVPAVSRAAQVLVELLRPIPSVALLPVALALFSSATEMKTYLATYACLWPILLGTIYALADVDPIAQDTLRTFGFGRLAILWRVGLPSSAPFIATGVRIAVSVGLVVTVIAELLGGGSKGIGEYLITTQSAGGHTDLELAGALWAGVLGFTANQLLVLAERRVFRWYHVRTEAAS
jgi:NitT/TauT family transport system permease protein